MTFDILTAILPDIFLALLGPLICIMIVVTGYKRYQIRCRTIRDLAAHSDPNSDRLIDIIAQEADVVVNGPRRLNR